VSCRTKESFESPEPPKLYIFELRGPNRSLLFFSQSPCECEYLLELPPYSSICCVLFFVGMGSALFRDGSRFFLFAAVFIFVSCACIYFFLAVSSGPPMKS